MGHPSNTTTTTTDTFTAVGISNATIKQHCPKAIDKLFYWVQDCVAQGQFTIVWKKGNGNLVDYFTNHHP
jgi:hypothetical protein